VFEPLHFHESFKKIILTGFTFLHPLPRCPGGA
jgi:hypothetical protein